MTPGRVFPDRYRIKHDACGSVLTCVEAPTVGVRVKHGFSVTAVAARSFPPGSIFLDGAAQGEPFLDSKREVYNLDHHEGCVRSFTLASCEQAMVLICRGLDLRKRDWTVYANDPDLDTVLAIWVLLNHIRLTDEDAETRARVMPLVRLQGAIDAHGLALQDLCALPPELLAETRGWIDSLRAEELALKAQACWQQVDPVQHTADRLRAIDRLVYSPKHFADVADIEELARAEIANGSVAIVCRSAVGIYEAERQLRRLHGKRLGVIVLQKDDSTYSLRQADPYLPASLETVYAHLNLVDPAAGGHRSANRWGGSPEIGGSPRGSGTRVTPQQIAEVCQQAFGTPTLLERVARIGRAVLGSGAIMLAALISVFGLRVVSERAAPALVAPLNVTMPFPALLLALGGALFLWRGRRTPGVYGLRRPAGLDWLGLLPLGAIAALAGGVWIPTAGIPAAGSLLFAWPELLALLALPLASEVLFRGLVHGTLLRSFPAQQCGGPWFLSWPVIVSAALYACWTAVLQLPTVSLLHAMPADSNTAGPLLGALVFGVAAGMARERSESVASAILVHWTCVASIVLAHARWS